LLRSIRTGKKILLELFTVLFYGQVAEAKLSKFLEEPRDRVSNGNSEVSAKMTFGEALKIHQQNQADNVTIKPTTRHVNAGEHWGNPYNPYQSGW
jgi:hypothetical protein